MPEQPTLGLPLAADEERDRLRKNMADLLSRVGQGGRCRGCHAAIWWVVHLNNARTPYDQDGTNHFVTCPKRDDFHKKGR